MKKLLVAVFLCVSFLVKGQDEGYTMFQMINLTPDNKNIGKLTENLKAHNEKFHNAGNLTAFVWSVATGPRIGQLIWMRGPLKFADLDNPQGKEHDDHWSKSVLPYVKKVGTLEYWKRNDKISNVEGDPRSKLFVRFSVVKDGQSYRVGDFYSKVNEVIKAMDGENPWAVWTNQFRQGDLGRHLATVSGFNDWAWIDEDNNFKDKFLEVHGKNSWQQFMNMQREIFKDVYDEIWVLAPELSGSN